MTKSGARTTWSLPEASRVTGASERQLHHWISTGLLDPVYIESGNEIKLTKDALPSLRIGGHGAYRFTWDELEFVSAVLRMAKAGISLPAIRQAHARDELSTMLLEVQRAASGGRRVVQRKESRDALERAGRS